MSVSEVTLLDLSRTSLVKDGLMFWCGPTKKLEYHDFFEISFILEGNAEAMINGEKKILEAGVIVIIRPYDVHYKQGNNIANFGVSMETFNALFGYLGNLLDKSKISRSNKSPIVTISDNERILFKERIEKAYAHFNENKNLATIESKAILLELLIKFAPWLYIGNNHNIPSWLEEIRKQMEEPRYFIEGLPALLKIAGYSQSYLCRIFKQYYNLTPTQHINNLRLKYAAYLLANVEIDILHIADKAGFDSLSHFYHCFKKFFHISPKRYRNLKVLTSISNKTNKK